MCAKIEMNWRSVIIILFSVTTKQNVREIPQQRNRQDRRNISNVDYTPLCCIASIFKAMRSSILVGVYIIAVHRSFTTLSRITMGPIQCRVDN